MIRLSDSLAEHPTQAGSADAARLLRWLVLLIVIAWRLQDFAGLGMTSGDDLRFSTDLLRGSVYEVALEYAKAHGRIYYLLTVPINLLAATFTTTVPIQALSLALLAFVPWMIAWMTYRSEGDAFVFLLAYWTLCAPGWHFTTPASYPIMPMMPLAFAGLAAVCAQRYLQAQRRGTLALFCGLVFAALFQYEPGALVALVFLIWFVGVRARFSPHTRTLLYGIGFSSFVYGAAYLAWRFAFPTAYEGATLPATFSVLALARVVAAHALGALPVVNLVAPRQLTLGDAVTGRQVTPLPPIDPRSLLDSIGWMDFVIGGAAAFTFWLLMSSHASFRGGPSRQRIAQAALGVLILVLSSGLLAFTAKYQQWARDWTPYLTSYYALFGWAILLVVAVRYASSARWSSFVVAAGFLALFLYSSGYNHATARQIRANYAKWNLIAALASCRERLPYDTFVVPTAFAGISDRAPNWSIYWRHWTLAMFGSELDVVAAPRASAAGRTATVSPELDDTGSLRAVVGHSDARGFVIHFGSAPGFLHVRLAESANGWNREQLVVGRDLETLRCRGRYRIGWFDAAREIDTVDASWHQPGTVPRTQEDTSIFLVPNDNVERAVEALYLAYALRPADPGGLKYWSEQVRQAGGTLRDVAEHFASISANDENALARDFGDRLLQSYQRLAGRRPTAAEAERLGPISKTPGLLRLLPWLVAADLFRSDDRQFANRLELARHYTDSVYATSGWRPDVWNRAAAAITDSPESVQRGMAALRR